MLTELVKLKITLMGSFIFCTSFFNNETIYRERYLRWIDYYASLEFSNSKPLIMIDDGSPDLSFVGSEATVWPTIEENDLGGSLPDKLDQVNIFTFPSNLGRVTHLGYWGWWRNFLFS